MEHLLLFGVMSVCVSTTNMVVKKSVTLSDGLLCLGGIALTTSFFLFAN
mgnify:CR=1 FL=1